MLCIIKIENLYIFDTMNKIISFLICSIMFLSMCAKERFHTNDGDNKEDKIALVILNGFGDSKKNRKIQLMYFKDKGMDVYIPKYKVRKSLSLSIDKFSKFYSDHELIKYKEVYFLCYIIGGYVLNEFILKNGTKNIKKVIYDRSPTQERAAKVGVDRLSLLSKLIYGKILFDFSKVTLKNLEKNKEFSVGVIIENQATSLMRYFEKYSYKYGKYSFEINDINSNNNDYFHTWLDHDLMYRRFDVIGKEILHFYKYNHFSDLAKREKYNWNPFKKVRL